MIGLAVGFRYSAIGPWEGTECVSRRRASGMLARSLIPQPLSDTLRPIFPSVWCNDATIRL